MTKTILAADPRYRSLPTSTETTFPTVSLGKAMKPIVFLFLSLACALRGHEIHGVYRRGDEKVEIYREPIAFDSFKKVADGRVYTLWVAQDAAFVFYIQKPWDGVNVDVSKPDSRFRIWLVQAVRELTLPKGFEDLESDEKGKVKGAEELKGRIKIRWKGDFDYVISLEVAGAPGGSTFSGYLFGSAENKAFKK